MSKSVHRVVAEGMLWGSRGTATWERMLHVLVKGPTPKEDLLSVHVTTKGAHYSALQKNLREGLVGRGR